MKKVATIGNTFLSLWKMERQITMQDAWPDFWVWIRQQPIWAAMGRPERNYLFRTQTAYKKGELGPDRTRRLLRQYAPDRYEFRDVVVIKE